MKKRVTQYQSRRGQSRRGMTLIEIMIVLGILVLLASMVGPALFKAGDKADIQSARTQIASLEGSLDHYILDLKTLPTTEQGLEALVKEVAGEESEEEEGSSKWDGPYISKNKIPKDPWGSEYQYEYPSDKTKGDKPAIWSYGKDKEDDTEDDIKSWDDTESEEGESDFSEDDA
jgi:general secretion pathway protein G